MRDDDGQGHGQAADGDGAVLLTVRDDARPGAAGPAVDVLLRAPGDGDVPRRLREVVDDLAALLDARGPGTGAAGAVRWWCGGEALHGDEVVGLPPLVRGAVLVRRAAAASARPPAPPRTAALVLHVVAGPDAGAVVPLGAGRHVVGRSPAADVVLDDPLVSRRHLAVDVRRDGTTATDLGSANGTATPAPAAGGGRAEPGAVAVGPGARLRLGGSTVELRLGGTPSRPLRWDGRGGRPVTPGPPPPAAPPVRRRTRPARPTPPEPPRTAWLPALLPLVLAVPMALLWSPWALLVGLASPLVALGTTSVERRAGRRRHAAAVARSGRLRAAADADVREAVTAEAEALRRAVPGATDVLAALVGDGPDLWVRPRGAPVVVAPGTGTAPSSTAVDEDDEDGRTTTSRPVLIDVPLVVDLDAVGGLAVVGPATAAAGTVRWVLLQVAALHRPDDVRVVVLVDDPARWAWARWLPCAGPDAVPADGPRARAAVAGLLAAAADRLAAPTPSAPADDRVLLVLDAPVLLRTVPGLADLVRRGPAAGVRTLAVVADEGAVPAGCGAVALLRPGDDEDLHLRADGHDPRTGSATAVGTDRAARAARAAAPLHLVAADARRGGVPRHVGLASLLGRPGAGPDDVARAWRSTAERGGAVPVPVGAGVDGPRLLDLAVDGPHALVAGTTGAGKSELLRTLVASLAWHHAPEDLSFVLVDYKGGAAFSAVASLPHVLGLVTDLDHRLTARALRSLGAEVARREALLQRVGAADLAGYRRARRPGDPALGRLVLVVDEFRVLAEELPDFVDGLVRLAAVGRSLGLHLVLATQRPAGVVGPDMAANVNLRVALRVRDELDSRDVVEARDAAHLPASVPGRSLWRTGGGPLEEVQVASGSARATAGPLVEVLGAPVAARAGGAAPPADDAGDLPAVVAAVVGAARRTGAPVPPSPWPDPLPPHVPLPPHDPSAPRVLRWGLVDEPARQRRRPLGWDLAARGHLLVVGGPRSGRTGAARAVLAAAASAGPDVVVAHVVDPGGELGSAAALPGVASVVAGDDVEHAGRVLGVLLDEVVRRRADAPGPPGAPARPTLLLVVDGYDAVQSRWEEEDGGTCAAALERLLREGPGADVLVLLTAGPRVVGGRVSAAVGERVVLAVADPVDAVLAGLPPRRATDGPPGRGVHLPAAGAGGDDGPDREPLEVQVADVRALDGARPAGGRDLPRPRRGGPAVVRVPALPRRVEDGSLLDLGLDLGPGDGSLLLGAGGTAAGPLRLDPAEEAPVLPVLGPAGSGRTTALAVLGRSALRGGAAVVVLGRPLPGLPAVPPGTTEGPACGEEEGRASRVVPVQGEPTALRRAVAARPPGVPLVVLVDDADLLAGTPEAEVLGGWATSLLGVGVDAGTGPDGLLPGDLLVVAGTPAAAATRGGLLAVGRRTRTGVLLGAVGPLDGELLGLPPGPRRGPVPPGRGVLVRRGAVVTVQVAVPGPPGTPPGRPSGVPPGQSGAGRGLLPP
ncbi:FtsK/SpoIIIE domain-containing protein [Pseudokineococcus lusitanus]|uniref:S-DNA-T family DNA segregation ATPase FtsK/SpoIIIE n=1 Tax=Pseudokineococcus lusitanus TaxID=763993 RepID=A0A3N1G967_9ACTN|nr:FtsK/SpoIIIE domain-containing protein [Pseudokineococcus lusitanus]ROP26782.1 S-DNA-T family DNA segregation ATPase FtsK/SpoIIIE [Pseudokineococcus lusitanus]